MAEEVLSCDINYIPEYCPEPIKYSEMRPHLLPSRVEDSTSSDATAGMLEIMRVWVVTMVI